MRSLIVLLLTVTSIFSYTCSGNIVNEFGDIVGDYAGYYAETSSRSYKKPTIKINYRWGNSIGSVYNYDYATSVVFDNLPYLGLTKGDCHMIKFRNEKTGEITTYTKGFFLDGVNDAVYVVEPDIVKWIDNHFISGAHYKVVFYDYDNRPNTLEFYCK